MQYELLLQGSGKDEKVSGEHLTEEQMTAHDGSKSNRPSQSVPTECNLGRRMQFEPLSSARCPLFHPFWALADKARAGYAAISAVQLPGPIAAPRLFFWAFILWAGICHVDRHCSRLL